MGFTTNYQIPYPGLGDIPDGAGQMQALAEQVDTKLKPIDNRVGDLETKTNTLNAEPFIALYRVVTGSCPASTLTPIGWDGIEENIGFTFTSGQATITVVKPGVYLLQGVIVVTGLATASSVHLNFLKNGVEDVVFDRSIVAADPNPRAFSGSTFTRLVAGDTFGLAYWGGACSITAGSGTTRRLRNQLSAAWIRP
jgi:hypothetical protein